MIAPVRRARRRLALRVALCGWAVCSSAGADTLLLENGDVISGSVIELRDDAVVLEHETLGVLSLPRESVKEIYTGAEADDLVVALEEIEPPPPPSPGLFGTGWLQGWSRRLGVGAAGTRGNSETTDVNASATADFEDQTRRWEFDAGWFFQTNEDGRQKNEAFAALRRDFLLPGSRFFLWSQGRYDYDQFEAWDHRLAGSAGTGYDIYASQPMTLRGRLGFGVSYTFGGGPRNDVVPEALAGLDLVWRIIDGQSLTASHEIYPSLDPTGEYRTLTRAEWSVAIAQGLGLHLKLGVENEYESDVEPRRPGPDGSFGTPDDVPGEKRNDLKYYGNLVYEF